MLTKTESAKIFNVLNATHYNTIKHMLMVLDTIPVTTTSAERFLFRQEKD